MNTGYKYPQGPLLSKINTPDDLRKLKKNQLKQVSNELRQYTKLYYEISFNRKSTFYYNPFTVTELDPIIIMTKFYPWIINYTINKGLDPDKPRYLTKVTQTF